MIIQTGMRTDIPAFYSEWLVNRIKESYVLVRNPYHPEQVTKYRLSPDVVDLIAFCTKNPAPMFSHMDIIKPYGQYWFVTITPYGKEIEPHVPDKETVIEDFKKLSDLVGVNSVGWRYDPILIDEKHTVSWHIEEFEKMAAQNIQIISLLPWKKNLNCCSVLLIFIKRWSVISLKQEKSRRVTGSFWEGN